MAANRGMFCLAVDLAFSQKIRHTSNALRRVLSSRVAAAAILRRRKEKEERRKEEGERRKEEGGRRKEEGKRRKKGERRKEEEERRKEEGGGVILEIRCSGNLKKIQGK